MAFLLFILSVWLALWLLSKFAFKTALASHRFKGRIAFAIAYFSIGLSHILSPEKLVYMIQDVLPYAHELVIISGILEMGLAVLLLVPRYQRLAGWAIIALLVLVFPANINVAVNNLPPPGGLPASKWYTWSRLLFQPVYIFWVWWCAIKDRK